MFVHCYQIRVHNDQQGCSCKIHGNVASFRKNDLMENWYFRNDLLQLFELKIKFQPPNLASGNHNSSFFLKNWIS